MCAHLNNPCDNCGEANGPGIWAYDFFCPNMPQRAITNTAKSKLTRIEPVTLNKKHPKNGRNTGTGKRVCVVGRLPTF